MIFSVFLHGADARPSLALVSALSLLAGDVLAQTPACADSTLAPLVVTAARVTQLQTDALPHTTVLTEQDIRDSQAVDLPSLLKREAGIQFTQSGGVGLASGLFVRGAETRQTLILLDGVPLTKQDTTGTVSIEHLMLDQIDRIEIVRGNVSSIYGSGAVGGVIQIFTKRGDGPARPNVSAEVGSRNTRRLSAGISGSSGATRYSLAASDFKTDGISALNPVQVPTANPDQDGYHNTSVSGALSHEWTTGHELGLRFSSSDGRYDFDSGFDTPTAIHTGQTRVESLTLFSQNRFNANWLSRVSFSEARDKSTTMVSAAGVTDSRFLSKTRLLQWDNQITLSPSWSATIGVEWQRQGFDSDDGYGTEYGKDRTANSVYGGVQGKMGAHQWQLNVRHDKVESVDSVTTGFFGYGYSLSQAWKLIANASTGFSAPSVGYLYDPWSGNPTLKPEHVRSAELGLQYGLGNTLVRATLFQTRTKDQFVYVSDPVTFMGRFENVAKTSNRGLEISASSKWLETDLRASLTVQEPRDESTDSILIRRARTLASLSANRSFGPLQIGGDLLYTGNRYEGARKLDAYWLANLTAKYPLGKGVSLLGRIENAFNSDYQTAYGYNQAPRGIFVGVSWQP